LYARQRGAIRATQLQQGSYILAVCHRRHPWHQCPSKRADWVSFAAARGGTASDGSQQKQRYETIEDVLHGPVLSSRESSDPAMDG
jgi:hypothetical protein